MKELKNENDNVIIDELRDIHKELKGIRKKTNKQTNSINPVMYCHSDFNRVRCRFLLRCP